MDFTKRQSIGLVGCVLLFIGVFLPIVSVPIAGGMNYFQNGRVDDSIGCNLQGLNTIYTYKHKHLNVRLD